MSDGSSSTNKPNDIVSPRDCATDSTIPATRLQGALQSAGTLVILLSLLSVTGAAARHWEEPVTQIKLGLLYFAVFAAGSYYYNNNNNIAGLPSGSAWANRCATLAVCAVPVVVHGVMASQGWLVLDGLRQLVPDAASTSFSNLHGYVIPMSLATIVASVLACRYSPAPQPLMTVPHVLALSCIGIELARLYRHDVSPHIDDCLLWGFFVLGYAWIAEKLTISRDVGGPTIDGTDYARYFYMMGASHVWYAVGYKWQVHGTISGLAYAALNIIFLVLYATHCQRRIFQVLGMFGLVLYVSHEARHLDIVSFACITVALGMALVVAGDRFVFQRTTSGVSASVS